MNVSERIEPGEQGAEAEQDEGMARIEGTAGGSPRGKRRNGPEAPHVDHPVDSRHRLEAERRYRVENRQDETDSVRDPKRGRERKGEHLTAGEQRTAEREQVSRQRRRRIQVSDVALVPVEI